MLSFKGSGDDCSSCLSDSSGVTPVFLPAAFLGASAGVSTAFSFAVAAFLADGFLALAFGAALGWASFGLAACLPIFAGCDGHRGEVVARG